jgi:hypothetical protein
MLDKLDTRPFERAFVLADDGTFNQKFGDNFQLPKPSESGWVAERCVFIFFVLRSHCSRSSTVIGRNFLN